MQLGDLARLRLGCAGCGGVQWTWLLCPKLLLALEARTFGVFITYNDHGCRNAAKKQARRPWSQLASMQPNPLERSACGLQLRPPELRGPARASGSALAKSAGLAEHRGKSQRTIKLGFRL